MDDSLIDKAAQTQRFHSNGKLMISGEYLVLSGALALALPVRYGQSLAVTKEHAPEAMITWTAMEKGALWFTTRLYPGKGLQQPLTADDDSPLTRNLISILGIARDMNPAFLTGRYHWKVITKLDFDRNWGLGSSSTLISNIAWWANADPYTLLFHTLGGSGYDIACARSKTPLLYHYRGKDQHPVVTPAHFNPPFAGQLYFVYTGRKQSSAKSLAGFDPSGADRDMTTAINDISLKVTQTSSLNDFQKLLTEHEAIIGRAIGKDPVGQASFADFHGVVKSLGAWGGDFLLVASDMTPAQVTAYFKDRGHRIIIPFSEMILPHDS